MGETRQVSGRSWEWQGNRRWGFLGGGEGQQPTNTLINMHMRSHVFKTTCFQPTSTKSPVLMSFFYTHRFPSFTPAAWSKVIPSASAEAIDLIAKLTAWDPARRLSSEQALRHPYFAVREGGQGESLGRRG